MRQVRGNDIAMIFQEPMTSLNPVLTIGFQIAEALICITAACRAGEPRPRRCACWSGAHPGRQVALRRISRTSFSGGMRQRVMIAMALACKPKLLIADEPTTALDVTIQAQILDLIKAAGRGGHVVLFITHDMGVVAEIADRTVVMYAAIAWRPARRPIFAAPPSSPYTKALLAAVPRSARWRANQPDALPDRRQETGAERRPGSADTVEGSSAGAGGLAT
jgi:peptide/nickel transport system ATP-binding protein